MIAFEEIKHPNTKWALDSWYSIHHSERYHICQYSSGRLCKTHDFTYNGFPAIERSPDCPHTQPILTAGCLAGNDCFTLLLHNIHLSMTTRICTCMCAEKTASYMHITRWEMNSLAQHIQTRLFWYGKRCRTSAAVNKGTNMRMITGTHTACSRRSCVHTFAGR